MDSKKCRFATYNVFEASDQMFVSKVIMFEVVVIKYVAIVAIFRKKCGITQVIIYYIIV